mmetsp:Transcript_19258/g.27810  ORF Transcript_19258/g.27810 Transcript_19258/m.27810 type:complete len:212 (-) Transcript_19258:439-1074(-)
MKVLKLGIFNLDGILYSSTQSLAVWELRGINLRSKANANSTTLGNTGLTQGGLHLIGRGQQSLGEHGQRVEVRLLVVSLGGVNGHQVEDLHRLGVQGGNHKLPAFRVGAVPASTWGHPEKSGSITKQVPCFLECPHVAVLLLLLLLRRVSHVLLAVDGQQVAPQAEGHRHGVRGHTVTSHAHNLFSKLRILLPDRLEEDADNLRVWLSLMV